MMSASLFENIMAASSDALIGTAVIFIYFGIMLSAIVWRLKKNAKANQH